MPKGVFELAFRYIEPSVKRAIVLKLAERKIPLTEISKRLGISPSLASRYTKGERGVFLDPASIPELNAELDKIADRIASGVLNGFELQLEVNRVIVKALSSKKLCSLHKTIDNSVDPLKCYVCPSLFKNIG